MSLILTSSQVMEAMIEHVRANLKLQDRQESESNKVITFMGRGITQEDLDVLFALEVVGTNQRALEHTHFNRTLEERTAPGSRMERTYTGFLFPKSIDYTSAVSTYHGPYFKQARLLPQEADSELRARYSRFNHYDVKDLSRIEWSFVIPLTGSRIAYYNPLTGAVQTHEFQKFPKQEPIPDNRPLDQDYLWFWLMRGHFPSKDNKLRAANTFRDIQQGLHDRVRHIIRTFPIAGSFTLKKYNNGASLLVPYE